MTQSADVLIVGGGVTGLSTAIHLAERGVDVVVLERHSIGSGQSGRAAGVLRGTVQHQTVAAMQLEGQEFFHSFESRFGTPLDVNQIGYLLIAPTHEREYVERTAAVATQAGCALSRISAGEAVELQPGLNAEDDEVCLLYEPGAIYVDPMPATHAMLLAAKASGVTVIEGCEVGSVRVEHDRVTGVETSSGLFDAPDLLIATSVWGQPQLAALGIDVPVAPHVAQMAFYHVPPASPFRLRRIIFDSRAGLYMRPEHDTQLFVGRKEINFVEKGGDRDPVDPDNYRQTATHSAVTEMSRNLNVTLPFMGDGFVHRTYACTYDLTPDEMPILDRAPSIRGLYFAVGFSGGGFSSSPWVGRRMASLIADTAPPDDLELFGLERFAQGELIQWNNTPT